MYSRHELGPRGKGRAGGDVELLRPPTQGARTNNTIDVRFEAGPDAAAAARNTIAALHGRVGDDLLNDVRLLVSELVTNSVRHSGVGPGDVVRMTIDHNGDALRVEVADPGRGFEPVARDLDRRRPGGWGLYLVNQLADRWGVQGGDSTRVWFEIDARNPRRARTAA